MSTPRLYADLAPWWHVMSSPAEYEEEARIFHEALERHCSVPIRDLLELGSGGGNNASHLKAHYRLTLVDLSEGMLAASRRLNPECEHVRGDMRTVRLDRTFDAVFIHDAICYMTTEADLRAAIRTARHHCRPDGVALFVPDATRDTWRASTKNGGHDVGDRSFRYLEWHYDPDPSDTQTSCSFAYMMREGDGPVRHEYDLHVMGLFPAALWLQVIEEAGFRPVRAPFGHSEIEPGADCGLFLGLPR